MPPLPFTQDDAHSALAAAPLLGLYWTSVLTARVRQWAEARSSPLVPPLALPAPEERPGKSNDVPPPLARTYDEIFAVHGQDLPVPYLRALAWHESRLQATARNPPPSTATGLLQVVDVVRGDFNTLHGTAYTRDEMIDPVVNVTIAAWALRRMADSLGRNHPHVPNLQEDWNNYRWVENLTAAWTGGWSESGGVGRVARHLEERGITEITVETIVDNAVAAGAAKYLSRERMVWWKKVAATYATELARDLNPLIAARANATGYAAPKHTPSHDAAPVSTPSQLDTPVSSPSQLDPSRLPSSSLLDPYPDVHLAASPATLPSSSLLDPYPDVHPAASPATPTPDHPAPSKPSHAEAPTPSSTPASSVPYLNPAALVPMDPYEAAAQVDPHHLHDATTSPPPLVSGPGWQWPVPMWGNYRPVVSDGWGSPRHDLNGKRRVHLGVDLMYERRNPQDKLAEFPSGSAGGAGCCFMPTGVPALAAAAGVVVYAQKTARGHAVQIAHPGNWSTFYQHLASLKVHTGETVTTGLALGEIGGDPTQKPPLRHLHFEIWRGTSEGGAFDPQPSVLSWQHVRVFPLPDGSFYAEAQPSPQQSRIA